MILVTGGAGYIGSHFVKHYLDTHRDETLVVVDNLSNGHREAVSHNARIRFYEVDIADQDRMALIFRENEITVVVHFAASIEVGESQKNPGLFFRNNVNATLRLFEVMEATGVRHILFSSTCATYGEPRRTPLSEEHPQDPVNVYGMTKLMIEQALKGYQMSKGWSWVALRYFNAAGASADGLLGESHEPETHLIPLVLQAATGQRGAIQIFGTDYDTPDGTCVRDFIHVEDLASAHRLAIQHLMSLENQGVAFNLGSEAGYSVREVIEVCERITGRTIPVKVGDRREGDAPVLVADARKIKTTLGWRPVHTLESIVRTAWQWEQSPRYTGRKPVTVTVPEVALAVR